MVGEVEPLGRARGADVEEVALLIGGRSPSWQAECGSALIAEERVERSGAGELAVLQRGAEDVAGARGSETGGAEHAHPALNGALPERNRDEAQCVGQLIGARFQAGELGQLGQCCACCCPGSQLELLGGIGAWRSAVVASLSDSIRLFA